MEQKRIKILQQCLALSKILLVKKEGLGIDESQNELCLTYFKL